MQSRDPRTICVIYYFIINMTITECALDLMTSNVMSFFRKGKVLRFESDYYPLNEKISDSLSKEFIETYNIGFNFGGEHKDYAYNAIQNLQRTARQSRISDARQQSVDNEIFSGNFSSETLERRKHWERRKQIAKRNSADELNFQRIVNGKSNCSVSPLQDWTFVVNNTVDYENGSHNNNASSHAPKFRLHTVVKGLVLFGLGFVALIGNVATFVSILRLGRHQSSTVYLLLIHLSVADLLVTWFCIVGEALWTFSVEWLGSDSMCKLYKFLQMFSLYLSTFTIIVIGFDRMFAVRYPMRRVNARNMVQKSIFSAWILSCLLSLPQVVIFRVVKGPFEEEFYQCVTYGFYTAAWQEQLYTSISLLFMFIIPLILLIATYSTTFLTIASKKRVFGDSPNLFEDARYKILRRAKVKSLWITVVIVTTFMVCWTPYYISMIITVFLEPDEQLGEDLNDAIFFFGSSTAVLNPIIYGAFHLKRKSRRPSSTSSSRYELTLVFSTLRRMRDSLARSSSSRQGSRKKQSQTDNAT